jgi:hypothetical protein
MSSMIIMWKAIKQQQEKQKRAISEHKPQARKLAGGCVLIQFPKIKSE